MCQLRYSPWAYFLPVAFWAALVLCPTVRTECNRKGDKSRNLHFSARLLRLHDTLDDTDSNGLTHVTNGETSKRRVVSESFHAHRLAGNHLDDASVTTLDEFLNLMLVGITRFNGDSAWMLTGAFSMLFPVRRSIFSMISENLQAMWAVWQSSTGA